ncbi:MAG: M48 family metallopeptidase [Actinomycetota bacterium]|nr:M48 family metallopeptidase [Acidimicrobiia bacterium]MDQ3293926.1 M48 family metallopeptidase [Actinomycetota bacterium]
MYDQVAQNKRRSWLLIAGFVLLVVAVVAAFDIVLGGGFVGVAIAVPLAGGAAFLSYWKSDSIALAMSRAHPADPQLFPRLHNLVEGLCIASGLPKPRVYVVDDPAPNAFATGRNPEHAAIAVTTGLLEKMNRVELEGVLAHELSHVKNYDILVSTLAVTMVGVIALLSDIGIRMLWWGGGRTRHNDRDQGGSAMAFLLIPALLLLLLSPLIASAMKAAVGRRRESLADISGVEMTRYPPGLISALEKLRDDSTVVHAHSRATSHLWIEEPAPVAREEGRVGFLNRLNHMFATHPPLDERIAALREL